MPSDPLREKYIQQLIGQLHGVAVVEGQRLIAKWLAEEHITREELVASLNPYEKTALLGAPAPPCGFAQANRAEGTARIAEWEQASAEWRRAYLGVRGSE